MEYTAKGIERKPLPARFPGRAGMRWSSLPNRKFSGTTRDMALYPLKFHPRLVEKMWGGRKIETVLGKPLPPGKPIGESWELFDFPPGVVEKSEHWVSAKIANGPLADKSLHWAVGEFGSELTGNVPLARGSVSHSHQIS